MFNILPLLVRIFNNSVNSKHPCATRQIQNLDWDCLSRATTDTKKSYKQKWKKTPLNTDRPRRGVKAKGLDVYDWKQYLADEALSPEVLIAIILGKTKINYIDCSDSTIEW